MRRDVADFFHMLGLNADRATFDEGMSLVMTEYSEAENLTGYAFCDESGNFHDHDFICLCGYLSTGSNWDRFIEQWQPAVSAIGLESVHMTSYYKDCEALGLDEPSATKALENLLDIIGNHVEIGFAVALDARFYKAMPKGAKNGLGRPPVACLQRLLRLIRDKLTSVHYSGRISVTLDDDETSAMEFYRTVSALRRRDRELANYIGACCFADDAFILPVQAADILSNLTGRWLYDRMRGICTENDVPPLLQRLLVDAKTGIQREYRNELWNEEALKKHVADSVRWGGDY